ncbi:acyl-CoA-binding protein [Flavobacterium muglaense]|uniref:Acyl-CoA-binding protein n=1 Tax=Flavobacterium muglaense TaxID=2764716 RepID=A0A923SE33_9FLAO|nr:acyl-CoA-binding protein [Flavobacterium muglaense]MBC5836663.1 acyl-CoA-binding protein [Flavobacterium muglaense]MBC5843071.1 acyl-CoA-binding protein [Flavobacterium muglaense]
MIDKDLDTQFQEAVQAASEMTQASLPQDVQLRLYAFYKQATLGTVEPRQTTTYHLRDAFKTNAWMQISHFSTDEAKEYYIEIINSLLKK